MISVESAGLSDIGRKRKRNEDAFFLSDDLKLYIVADGMGGHQAGDIASKLLIDTLIDYMKQKNTVQVKEENMIPKESFSKEASRLLSSISLTNRTIYQAAQAKKSYQGMGSTVSAVLLTDDTLIAANVGDSPIYLIRQKTVDVLSVPHTLIAEQQRLFPDADMLLVNKFRHILTKAMGMEDNVEADLCEIQPLSKDVVVICSDGLSEKVSTEEIREIVHRQRPLKACRTLVDLANKRGGDDNITVIVLLLKKVQEKK